MSTEPTPDDAERLLEQACAWLSKMHSGEFPESARQELEAWRAADLAHRQAWQRAQALWDGLGKLPGHHRLIPGAQPLPGEVGRQMPVVLADLGTELPGISTRDAEFSAVPPLPNIRRAGSSPITDKTRNRRTGRRSGLAVACSALLAVVLSTVYPPAFWRADYLTGKGEQRSVTLADGSRLTLNTSTALAIHFEDAERRVELLAGEAFFEVAKDPRRPFVVRAAGSEVRAVGTAFDVQRRDEQIQVELVEGIVEIQDARHQHRERLLAGQTARIGVNDMTVQSAASTESMALWRDGYLQFDGLPLQEAVTRINRYRPGRVLLLNPAFADKRISGLFRLDALDQAVVSLKAAIPQLRIINITPYLVVLR